MTTETAIKPAPRSHRYPVWKHCPKCDIAEQDADTCFVCGGPMQPNGSPYITGGGMKVTKPEGVR